MNTPWRKPWISKRRVNPWAVLMLCWAVTSVAFAEPQRVMVPSYDRGGSGQPLMLIGHWSPAPAQLVMASSESTAGEKAAGSGAMLLLHG